MLHLPLAVILWCYGATASLLPEAANQNLTHVTLFRPVVPRMTSLSIHGTTSPCTQDQSVQLMIFQADPVDYHVRVVWQTRTRSVCGNVHVPLPAWLQLERGEQYGLGVVLGTHRSAWGVQPVECTTSRANDANSIAPVEAALFVHYQYPAGEFLPETVRGVDWMMTRTPLCLDLRWEAGDSLSEPRLLEEYLPFQSECAMKMLLLGSLTIVLGLFASVVSIFLCCGASKGQSRCCIKDEEQGATNNKGATDPPTANDDSIEAESVDSTSCIYDNPRVYTKPRRDRDDVYGFFRYRVEVV